jgi:O-methyltransferase involved in polyketide biosynthesis
MKPNEPSRTALMIARQRAAHQVLDHGSILYDPFAMKILREDEKDVLQFANAHPLASIGRLFTAARRRIAEDALSRAVDRVQVRPRRSRTRARTRWRACRPR